MGWLSDLFENDKKTFDQDLELLIARWTNAAVKREEALPIGEIGERLLSKAERILDDEASRRKRKKHEPRN